LFFLFSCCSFIMLIHFAHSCSHWIQEAAQILHICTDFPCR
jgi:hypothetical protein